jgi:hypothetical protein
LQDSPRRMRRSTLGRKRCTEHYAQWRWRH